MSVRGKRRDANEPELCKLLRDLGAEFWLFHQPFDAFVAFRGRGMWGDFKSAKGEWTPQQLRDKARMERHGLTVHWWVTKDDVLRSLGLL